MTQFTIAHTNSSTLIAQYTYYGVTVRLHCIDIEPGWRAHAYEIIGCRRLASNLSEAKRVAREISRR